MDRHETIKNAYKNLGNEATFYDGMITCSTLPGKAVCKLVWNMDKKKNDRYLHLALSGIPENFSGRLLEVPVGTGVLTMPIYEALDGADITCLDYSADMMERAKRQAEKRGIANVRFMQGDVGKLPFEDGSFDLVLSLNGFHAFPDKEAAYSEIFRVLKPDGIFCGCFYVKGENKRTDWLIEKLYTPRGFFTPPYETVGSLKERLKSMYKKAEIKSVESMAVFRCRKGKDADNTKMLNCHIKSLYLCVKNMERAISFYESFFEKEVTVKDEIYSVFDINGFRLGLFAFEKKDEKHSFGTNCLPSIEVASLDILKRKISNLELCFPLTQINTNWVAEFVDSEGNHIELTAPV